MKDIFEKFNSLNILIIGDVMVDSYVWGRVERMSPEAPVPVVQVTKTENRLGGAANVALNIQALGATPLICAVSGEDKAGNDLIDLFDRSKLSTEGMTTIAGRPTTVKTRIIAQNQHIVRVDSETDLDISEEETLLVKKKIMDILDKHRIDAIIFEDYDKGLLSESLITGVISLARQNNILTAVDPKKKNFHCYKGVDLFKPNLKELREGLKEDIRSDDIGQIRLMVEKLKNNLDVKAVMLTLSEHGVYINSGDSGKLIPAHVRDIADVSGAGDTVIATTAVCMAAGLDMFQTAAVANLAGGLVCEHAGVVPIDKALLLQEAELLIK